MVNHTDSTKSLRSGIWATALGRYPEYSDDVLNAVLQHHERLDGSGYPRSLRGHGMIGLFGQIIAVAEVIASQHDRNSRFGRLRLETILKLNSRRYGGNLIGHLKVFYRTPAEIPPCTPQDREETRNRLAQLGAVLESWKERESHCAAAPAVCDFVHERMRNLQMEISDSGLAPGAAGFDLGRLGEEDSQVCREAGILLDEAIWRVSELVREIRRRWPQVEQGDPAFQPIGEWLTEVDAILKKTDHHLGQSRAAG